MTKSFKTGLAILLPIGLTVLIVNALVNFLTHPFLQFTQMWLTDHHYFQFPLFFMCPETLNLLISKVLILFCLTTFTLFIGILGKLFLMKYFFRLGDSLFAHVPIVNKIYKACQDVVYSLFSSSSQSFSQVVLVPYPHAQHLTMGLVIRNRVRIGEQRELVPVFVPGTPNPSVGFIMMFKEEQLVYVDMTVEAAMKYIVSCGVVISDFSIIQPPIYDERLAPENYFLSSEG